VTIPSTIRERDGTLVPFHRDDIARRLFAVRPQALLSRELAEGVQYFLAETHTGDAIDRGEFEELLIKVVRELGHPALALQLADRPSAALPNAPPTPDDVVREALEQFSLAHAFPPDIAAAHREGIFEILDLDCPNRLNAAVLPHSERSIAEALLDISARVGRMVAIDDMPYDGDLESVLRATGLRPIVNIHCDRTDAGPLFPANQRNMIPHEWFETGLPIRWHLSRHDLEGEQFAPIVERALRHRDFEFVIERQRQSIHLGYGLTRSGPAISTRVRVRFDRFLAMLGPCNQLQFLKKLTVLGCLLAAVGRARRAWLTQHGDPALTHGFALERSQLLIEHRGLMRASLNILGPSADEQAAAMMASQCLSAVTDGAGADRFNSFAPTFDWQPSAEEQSPLAVLGECNMQWSRHLRLVDQLNASDPEFPATIFVKQFVGKRIQEVSLALRSAFAARLNRLRLDCVEN